MLSSPAMDGRAVLYRLGLSRSAAVVLAAYLLVSLGLEQALPSGETLLYTPFGMGIWPLLIALLAVLNAVAHECRRPRTTIRQRAYWAGFAYTAAAGLLFFSFCISFGYMKSLIPVFHPFYLDPWLERYDILLHGGTAPWHWFIGWLTPARTALLSDLYLSSWVSVISLYFLWQLVLPPSHARCQFISCFYLLWIVGGIMLAILGASVGPVYYSLFYHDAYSAMNAGFVAQLYDGTAPATSGFDARQLLLDLQATGSISSLNGMSAMPSMHVGTAFLIALHSYRHARPLAWLTLPFAALIFLGSVALGWHYALDGYAAAGCVAALWWLTELDISRAAKAPPSRGSSAIQPPSPAVPKAARW